MKRLLSHLAAVAVAVAVAVAPFGASGQEFNLDELDGSDGDILIESSGTVLIDGPFDMNAVLLRLDDLFDEPRPKGNGDVNADSRINISDAVYLLRWLLRDGPAPVPLAFLPAAPAAHGKVEPFRRISLGLEFNVTDGETDLMLSAKHDDGLSHLTVRDPQDRVIFDLRAEEGRELSLDEIVLESGSGSELEAMTSAYPQGEYLFEAVTTSRTRLAGLVNLTHDLLSAPVFAYQADPDRLLVQWIPIFRASGYWLEVRQDDLGFALTVELQPNSVSFAVPSALLHPGVEYELSLGTVSRGGNISVVETDFTIATSEPSAAR